MCLMDFGRRLKYQIKKAVILTLPKVVVAQRGAITAQGFSEFAEPLFLVNSWKDGSNFSQINFEMNHGSCYLK